MVDRVGHGHLESEMHHLLVIHCENVLLHNTVRQNLHGFILHILDSHRGTAWLRLEHVQVVISADVEVRIATVHSN